MNKQNVIMYKKTSVYYYKNMLIVCKKEIKYI